MYLLHVGNPLIGTQSQNSDPSPQFSNLSQNGHSCLDIEVSLKTDSSVQCKQVFFSQDQASNLPLWQWYILLIRLKCHTMSLPDSQGANLHPAQSIYFPISQTELILGHCFLGWKLNESEWSIRNYFLRFFGFPITWIDSSAPVWCRPWSVN